MKTRKGSHLPRFVCLALVCLLFANALTLLAAASAPGDGGETRESWTVDIKSVTTPTTTYGPGETVNATVTVERGPDMLTAEWEGTLTLAVLDWTGDAVHFDSLPVELWQGGAQQTSYFEFDLTQVGEYMIRTTLYWRNDTVDMRDLNISVVRGSPPGDAAVWISTLDTDKDSYEQGDVMDITVIVTRGPDMLTHVWEGTLELQVLSEDIVTLTTYQRAIYLPSGGDEQTLTFSEDLTDGGNRIIVATLYWMDGTFVEERRLNVTVARPSPPTDPEAWISSLTIDKESYQAGDVMAVTVTVVRGDDLLDHVWEGVLTLNLLDTGRNNLGTWNGPVELHYGGATQTLSHSFDLDDAGDRILVASLYYILGTPMDERVLNLTVTQRDTNQPPKAAFDPANQTIGVTDTARIDGSLSHDNDGSIVSYVWDLGDGTTATGAMVAHVYRSPGTFSVTLTVTDDDGATSVARGAVRVLAFDPPPPDPMAWIVSVTSRGTVNESEVVTITVTVVRGDDMLDYVWTGTLVLEVLDDGPVKIQSRQVHLATGGEETDLVFQLSLDEAGNYTIRASLYGQDDSLVDTEEAALVVVSGPQDPGTPIKEAEPFVPVEAVAAAGILVVMGALAATEVGKASLLGLLVPLYTKLRKGEILDQFTRGRIYGYITANPGDHYNSIQKALDIPNGTFAYHLQVLEKEGYIRSVWEGTHKCFFPAGMKIPSRGNTLRSGQRLIIETILEEPGISQKEIAESLGVSSATVNYHIKDLLQMGVVETERKGMRLKYYINRDLLHASV